ncbi:MAG: hypothetical protein HOW73_12365 [Polyangiaceae bacterium]|nr:hypothetical protein [Polyangiaceae bacterium]
MTRAGPRSSPHSNSEVVIASDSPETLDGLQSYLAAAGLRVRGTRKLDGAALTAENVAAVVVFADDFDGDAVLSLVARMLKSRVDLLPLIVSGEPRRFDALVRTDAPDEPGPIVIPKPAWGSMILDTIRKRLKG